ncbi:MAG TPA: lysylphosphatidylglycerol synthase transmembrane domain-containing protein [Thermomicrobiales bacterium]|nr:lysylphosphatidylglycerol synthase transmembrane domain-containing protein [Thermomicrobiales bacterium]
MRSQLRRIILITIAIGIVLAVVFFVDFGTLLSALGGLSVTALVSLFLLLAISAVVKAVRWAYFLRAARLDISWRNGMTTYLAGMTAGALPGGSWLPVRLAQEHGTVRMRQAAAALFVAFVGDIIGISLVAWASLLITRQPGPTFVLPAIGLFMAGVLIAMGRSRRVWMYVDRLLARSRVTRRWLPQESDIQSRVNALMRSGVIARGALFSIATTSLSAVVLVVVVRGLTFTGISWRDAFFVHSMSETTAIVIPIPGGIGTSDSSLAGLMNSLGIGWVRATYVVLALRSADLLFKTIVGSLLLVAFYNKLLMTALKVRSRAGRAGQQAKRVWKFSSEMTRRGTRTARISGARAHEPSRQPVAAAAPSAQHGQPPVPAEPRRPSTPA